MGFQSFLKSGIFVLSVLSPIKVGKSELRFLTEAYRNEMDEPIQNTIHIYMEMS
jgi:hypothetical protein